MNGRSHVLAIIEPDNSPKAVVDRAAWVAKILDCDLVLLLCDSSASVLGDGFFVSNEAREIGTRIRQAQQDLIDELAEDARDAGVNVTTDVLEQRPVAEGVMSIVLDTEPKLVMKGTQYHSVSERAIMLDTDWQLIRKCARPLWLVKTGPFQDQPSVIAAVDPTHEHDKPAALDQAIIDAARMVTVASGGDLHLFHTYKRLVGIGSEVSKAFKSIKLPVDEVDQRMKKEHRDALDALAKKNGIDKDHTHQLPGRTRDILPGFARSKKADLVVMGALARWGIKRMVIGSTAERVLDHLPCDVLIVRAK